MKRYKENKAINQSLIKECFYGLKDKVVNPSFVVGDIIDRAISENIPLETLLEEYKIVKSELNPKLASLFNIEKDFYSSGDLIENIIEGSIDTHFLKNLCRLYNYGNKNWKYLTLWKKVREQALLYKELIEFDKTLSNSSFNTVMKMKYAVEEIAAQLRIEGYEFQKDIYWHKDFDKKALLDAVKIDHDNKTINIIDFKTTSQDLFKFKNTFYKYGYNIQALWYIEGMQTLYPDYTISFNFIVISKITGKYINICVPNKLLDYSKDQLNYMIEVAKKINFTPLKGGVLNLEEVNLEFFDAV